jgi:hypothetical protein
MSINLTQTRWPLINLNKIIIILYLTKFDSNTKVDFESNDIVIMSSYYQE